VKLALGLVLLAGCLRTTTFPCASDAECGTGTCEPVGFCSFADTACTEGRRFGEHSGSYAGQCVGEITGDAGVDAPPDAFSGCIADYVTITGGEAGHRYRLRASTATWDSHRTTCASEGGYLAVPSSLVELQGMIALGATPIFVGISDLATENTWVDVNGAPATYLPWGGGQPDDDSPGEDCVHASATSFTDERCSRTARAVCECVE